MRTHRVFPALQPWSTRTDLLRDLVSGDHLATARIEPVTRSREAAAFADLHFTDGERSVTVPLVYLDLAQLDVRELDPLIFPYHLLGLVPDARARDIVERMAADLERRFVTREFERETVISYRPDALFDAARAAKLFGAAPLSETLPRIAAAIYARRFSAGKRVAAYGPDAVELAAFTRAGATSTLAFGTGAEGVADRWYGNVEAAAPGAAFDVLIGSGPSPDATGTAVIRLDADAAGLRVGAASPLPADLMVAFDIPPAPGTASFAVTCSREPFTRDAPEIAIAPPTGGSAGRIAVVVRPDASAVPDADTDEARALATGLCAEGFTAEVVCGIDALEAFAPDLVHLMGSRPGGYARRVADWASSHRKPLAVHAYYEAPAHGGYWGAMVAPYCFGYSGDDRSVSSYLELLARRGVDVDGIGAGSVWAPPIVDVGESEAVLNSADIVFVNSDRELAVVKAFRTHRPSFIVPALPLEPGPRSPIAALAGNDPFVLVHAPIGPDQNQLMIVRAAASMGVPFVLAGPLENPVYAERLREFNPELTIVLGEPAPGVLAALYRAAAVFADASWTGRGHARLLTAAAMGAAVVRPATAWLNLPEDDVWVVDPADLASVARGMGEAWDAAVRRDPRIERSAGAARQLLGTAVGSIVAAYAKIAQAVP